jgi:hypothetical protein
MRPYKGITARALLLPVNEGFSNLPSARQIECMDAAASSIVGLTESFLSPGELSPLPIMGIPGWDDNEAASYYDDARVFR